MPRRHNNMRRTQLYLTQPQLVTMQWVADETGMTVSEHFRRAVKAYLESKDIKPVASTIPLQLDLLED